MLENVFVGIRSTAFHAEVPFDVSMQLMDSGAACPVVQVVDILRDDRKPGKHLLHSCKGVMAGIRLDAGNDPFAMSIPLPHELRVLHKRVDIRQLFRLEFLPDSVCAAECGNATLS
jgi:hypothetical protein